MKKKLLSLLMALAMVLSLLPTWAIAVEGETELAEETTPVEEQTPAEDEEPSEEQTPAEDEELPEEEQAPKMQLPQMLAAEAPKGEPKVAKIGGVEYATLALAEEAAQDGNTVKLLKNATLDAELTVSKNITFDLNGMRLTLNADITVAAEKTLTIVDDSVGATGGVVCQKNINVEGTLNVSTLSYGYTGLIANQPGHLVIKSGGNAIMLNSWTGKTAALLDANSSAFFEGTENGAQLSVGGADYVRVNGRWQVPNAVAQIKRTVNEATYYDTYATLAEAINAAADGETVELLADVTIAQRIGIDKQVTLDLNGKTISAVEDKFSNPTSAVIGVMYNGDLTIEDSVGGGKIDSKNVYAAISMTLLGDTKGDKADATLTVNGGTLEGYHYGIVGNGTRHGTNITINGGTVRGVAENDSAGIYHPQAGTLTINGGTIEGANGIYSKSGEVKATVTAGTIKGVGDKQDYQPCTDGFKPTGDALVLDNCGYPGGTPNADIEGGTFESTNGSAVASYAKTGYTPIAGFIFGGTFSSEPDETLLVEDYEAVKNGNAWTVQAEAGVAAIGDKQYPTLAKAVEAATDGDTVKLLKDVDLTSTGLRVKKNITLDLNGYDVKVGEHSNNNILVSGATLTLEDNAANSTGKIYTEEEYASGVNNGVIRVTDGAFVMNSGKIEAVMANAKANGQFAVAMGKNCTVTINDGEIEAGWYAISGNGSTGREKTTIVVNGGTLISTADYAIYNPAISSTVTVNGGTVYGAAGGISMNNGTLTVNGGTITSEDQGSTGTWSDGTGGQGNAAINVNADYGDVTANISGGTITAEGQAVVIAVGTTHTGTISITGGTFSSNVSTYVAEGYTCVEQDGVYKIGKTQVVTEVKEETTQIEVKVDNDTKETTVNAVADTSVKTIVQSVVTAVKELPAFVSNAAAVTGKAGATVKVELKTVEVKTESETKKLDKVAYEVKPVDADDKVITPTGGSFAQKITFILPVPAEWANKTSLDVWHADEGAPMGTYAVQGEEGAKYVEVSNDQFSLYLLGEHDAANDVLQVGDVTYPLSQLQQAIDAAVENDTELVQIKAVDLPDGILAAVPDGKSLTINVGDFGYGEWLVYISGDVTVIATQATAPVLTATIDTTAEDRVEGNELFDAYKSDLPLSVNFAFVGDATIYGVDLCMMVNENFTVETVEDEGLPTGWAYFPDDNELYYTSYDAALSSNDLGTLTFKLKDAANLDPAEVANVKLVTIDGERSMFTLNSEALGDAAMITSVTIPNVRIICNSFEDKTVAVTTDYDGNQHSLAVKVLKKGTEVDVTSSCTIKYSETESGDYTATNPTFTNAGEYTVYYKVTADGYEPLTGSKTVTISKADMPSNLYTAPTDFVLNYNGAAQSLGEVKEKTAGTIVGWNVEYTVNNGTASTTAPTATGCKNDETTYTVSYKITSKNYKDVTGNYTVTIKRVDYVVYHTPDGDYWFAKDANHSYKLALVFTDSELFFSYTGSATPATYDVSAMGYKYTKDDAGEVTLGGTTPAPHVYAFLYTGTFSEENLSITKSGTALKVLYTAANMKKGDKEYDVNVSATVDLNDAVLAQQIINGSANYVGNLATKYSYVFRADVDKNGTVDIFDCGAIRNNYTKKN